MNKGDKNELDKLHCGICCLMKRQLERDIPHLMARSRITNESNMCGSEPPVNLNALIIANTKTIEQ